MPLYADSIMTLAGRVLNDEGAVRWTLPELCGWINEAVRSILLAKPSANSTTVVLALGVGTLQTVAPGNLSLLRIVRNIKAAGPPVVGGRIVRVTDRAELDAGAPYWHDSDFTPYQKEVRQFIYDEEDPRAFYVYPGNNGQGQVEAIVSQLPTAIAASGDPAIAPSYQQDIGLVPVYQAPILDYVLFRALSKDDTGANPAGAMAHFQAFAAAVGLKTQVEGANSPNARAGK